MGIVIGVLSGVAITLISVFILALRRLYKIKNSTIDLLRTLLAETLKENTALREFIKKEHKDRTGEDIDVAIRQKDEPPKDEFN